MHLTPAAAALFHRVKEEFRTHGEASGRNEVDFSRLREDFETTFGLPPLGGRDWDVLPPRLNLRLSISGTQKIPSYTLSSGTHVVHGHSQLEVILLLEIVLLGSIAKTRRFSRRYDMEKIREALKKSRRAKHDYGHLFGMTGYYWYLDYLGLVMFFPQQGAIKESVTIAVKKYQDVPFALPRGDNDDLIAVGLDGEWCGDGPWIALAASALDDIIAENTHDAVVDKARRAEAALVREEKKNERLKKAAALLWRDEVPEVKTEAVNIPVQTRKPRSFFKIGSTR